jgi:hypothetical protein
MTMHTLEPSTDLVSPLAQLLEELATVLAGVSDDDYCRKPVGVMPGSIGGHVRHCLDHVAAISDAGARGVIDYDHRERGTPIEFDRRAARDALHTMIERIGELPDDIHDRPIMLTLIVSPSHPPTEVVTSFGRELAYLLSHTVHHNAIIGAMVRMLGGDVPATFGYAPATIAHQQKRCAR